MSTVPIIPVKPDLDLPQFQKPDLLQSYGQMLALRNEQTEAPLRQQALQQQVQSGAADLQIKQQQIKDQQAMTATMQQWGKPRDTQPAAGGTAPAPASSDTQPAAGGTAPAPASSMPSYDDLVPLAIKNGASWNAVQGLQQHVGLMKAQAATIAMDDARAGSSNADALKTKNGMIVQAMSGVLNQPDQQLPQAIQQTARQLAQEGLFDPSHVQQAMQLSQLAQQNPAQARQQLQTQAVSLGAFSQLVDDAQKQLQLKDEAGKTDPNSPLYSPSDASLAAGTAPGAPQINAGKARQAANVAGAEEQARMPGQIQVAAAEGQARANVETAAARGNNQAVANVPKELVSQAMTDATKAGTDYTQAQAVTQTIKEMMADARDGNVVAYRLIPQEGTLEVTTSQGVHRITMSEIQNYGGGGSMWQRMEGHIGGALTGETIPASVLNDMDAMQDAVQHGARSKYVNTLKVINHNYGANFTPMDTDGAQSSAPSASGPMTVTLPSGKQVTIQ